MTEQREKVHEFFEQLAISVTESLLGKDVDPELAEAAGWDAADQVKRDWGGELLYIPKGTWQEFYRVHQEIYRKWNAGAEVDELAREYGRSVPATRLIIRKMRKRTKEQQPTLFDGLEKERDLPTLGEA